MSAEKVINLNHPTHHPQLSRDLLQYEDYAEAICLEIFRLKNYNDGITFGVLGEWGMGKSTVLKMLARRLGSHSPFTVIQFDAWKYLHQEDLWLALIRRIVTEIRLEKFGLPKWLNLRLRMRIQQAVRNPKLIDAVFEYFLKISGFCFLVLFSLLVLIVLLKNLGSFTSLAIETISIAGVVMNVSGWGIVIYLILLFLTVVFYIGKALFFAKLEINLPPLTKQKFDQDQIITIDNFKQDFNIMLKSLGGRKTIVVLIDDLDRCPPNQIVPVLEAIKHLGLDSDSDGSDGKAKLIFVLAIDADAVEQALSGYFKEYFQGVNKERDIYQFARNYLGKIIQVPILLPPLTESQLDMMLSGILNNK